jgi:hypothetical protein
VRPIGIGVILLLITVEGEGVTKEYAKKIIKQNAQSGTSGTWNFEKSLEVQDEDSGLK